MTHVQVTIQNNKYHKVVIVGHANFDKRGSDIVCAGISAIVFGTLNTLAKYDYNIEDIEVETEQIIIDNIVSASEIQLIIDMMLIQLETVRQEYPKYLKINNY